MNIRMRTPRSRPKRDGHPRRLLFRHRLLRLLLRRRRLLRHSSGAGSMRGRSALVLVR